MNGDSSSEERESSYSPRDQHGRIISPSSLPAPLAIETSIESSPDRITITITTLQFPGITLGQMPMVFLPFQAALEASSPAVCWEERELLSITMTLTLKQPEGSSDDSSGYSGTDII